MTDFPVLGPTGSKTLTVTAGRPLFIVGRNGTGKSALVHNISQNGGARTVYLPGNRTSIFDGEGLSLTSANRKNLCENMRSWDSSPDTRWRNISGNQRNERAIHDLTASENKYKNDFANAIALGVDVEKNVARLQAKASPLDRVNLLLEQSNIPVRMALLEGELKAKYGEQSYSFARMSDGERTALILIAEVLSGSDDAVFVIDEPELHLHRSIVVPLISSLVKHRPTCEFVISTHELNLPTAVPSARICIVRSVEWTNDGAVQSWDFDVVDNADELPDELTTDILGSRRRVLFTEGEDASLDVPMYAVLFPEASVRPKGGCRAVVQAVLGVRSTKSLHNADGYGLIDNDGMSTQLIAEHQAKGIYPLPVFSVESLYYDLAVVTAVAQRQAATMAAQEQDQEKLVSQYVADAVAGVVAAAAANSATEHLAGRIAERQVRDTIVAQLPQRDDLISAGTSPITVSEPSPYPAELAQMKELIAHNDAFEIIARYPVRHSGILGAVAKALKFRGREDYEAAALARVASDPALRNQLLAKLSPLSEALITA